MGIINNFGHLLRYMYLKKKGKYVEHTCPNLILIKLFYLALLPLELVAAAQITRPNAILLTKSAKL